MTIIIAKCDGCGKIINIDEVNRYYNDEDYCEQCFLKKELDDLIEEFKSKRKWLEETHIKDLIRLKKEILELRLRIQ